MEKAGKIDCQVLENVVEDKFGIGCLDESYKPTGKRTISELAAIICNGLTKRGATPDPKRVLFELRSLLVEVTNTPPIRVHPETELSALFDYRWEK